MAKNKERLYASVDVGTTKVATMVARATSNESMEIIAVGHTASEGMKKGMVVSPTELTASIRESADEARRMLGSSLPPVLVGITGGHLTCINAAASLDRNGSTGFQTFSQFDVDRILASTVNQGDHRRRVVHVVPRTYQVDGLKEVRNPVGMRGETLTAEAHVVVGDAATMENLEQVVKKAGVKVKGLVIEHLASAEAVLSEDEREQGVVLVDIGGGTSDIAIYQNGNAWYTAAIPVAGQHFTNDVAVGIGLPPSVAERAKIDHGSAIVTANDARQSIELDSGLGDHTREVSMQSLNQLLHDRAVELAKMIVHKIVQSGLDNVPDGGIVLTGGSANLKGLPAVLGDYARCRVRVASPAAALGLPPELERSSFSTGVGLLLWAIKHQHPGAVAMNVTLDDNVLNKVKGWFTRFAPHRATEVRA